MAELRKPDPPTYESDDVRTVLVVTVLWAVALAVLLPFWPRLSDSGRGELVATCACGLALGAIGFVYTRRRAAAIARDRAAAAGTSDKGPSSAES